MSSYLYRVIELANRIAGNYIVLTWFPQKKSHIKRLV